jgi:molecular chaperone DnaJ
MCRGAGQVESVQGFFSLRRTCPRCRGEGYVIADPCPGCRGEGRLPGRREVKVEVPPGVQHGVQLRIQGEGDAGIRGGSSGSLYCVIQERKHEIFERVEDDILCEVPISFSDAALGVKTDVPTLRGKLEVSVPPGTQSGEVLRLRGKGLPSLDGRGTGHLLVRIVVETPKKVNGRMRELLEELRSAESAAALPARSGFFEKLKQYFKGETERFSAGDRDP